MIVYLMIVDQFIYSKSDLDGKHIILVTAALVHHGLAWAMGNPRRCISWHGLRHCKGAWTEANQKYK